MGVLRKSETLDWEVTLPVKLDRAVVEDCQSLAKMGHTVMAVRYLYKSHPFLTISQAWGIIKELVTPS